MVKGSKRGEKRRSLKMMMMDRKRYYKDEDPTNPPQVSLFELSPWTRLFSQRSFMSETFV